MISLGDALIKMGVDKTNFDASMRDADKHVKTSMQSIQSQLKATGAAFTAVGVAGMKMVSDARKMNAQLGQTALTLGITTKEMRDLALSTTNVTFPLKSVQQTFDLLARAGMRNADEMQKAANAFDALADATGNSAEVVADLLLPAFKLFGEEIPQTSAELDKFTWLTKNTMVDLSDFGTLLTRMAPYMDDLNMSMDDAIATLAALSEQGIVGTAATLKLRTAITQAASSGEDLNTMLGISQDEINGFKRQMEGAVGITDRYAEVANTQFTILDKLKQKWSELTLSIGSVLTPFEGVLAAMATAGPILLTLSITLPRLSAAFHSLAVAIKAVQLATLGPIALAIAAIVAAGYGIYKFLEYAATPAVQTKRRMAELNEELKQTQNELQNAQLMLENFASDYTRGEVDRLQKKLSDLNSELGRLSGKTETSPLELWTEDMEAATHSSRGLSDATDDLTDTMTTQMSVSGRLQVAHDTLEDGIKSHFEWARNLKRGVDDLVSSLWFEVSAAGKLGLTIDDVGRYVRDVSGDMDAFSDALYRVQGKGGDVNDLLRELGLTAEDVSKQVSKIGDAHESAFRRAGEAILSAQGKLLGYAIIAEARLIEPIGEAFGGLQRAGRLATLADTAAATPGATFYLDPETGLRHLLATGMQPAGWMPDVKQYQHGGIIPEPTLLYGLKSMKPYAVAGEKGAEYITPSGGYKTANIIITLDGETIARQIGTPLVDMIRMRQGLVI